MDLSYTSEHELFRAEVRRFLDQHWTEADRKENPPPKPTWLIARAERRDPAATKLRLLAIERGYLYRHVPRAYGGGEQPWDPAKEMIIAEEFDRAEAPGLRYGTREFGQSNSAHSGRDNRVLDTKQFRDSGFEH